MVSGDDNAVHGQTRVFDRYLDALRQRARIPGLSGAIVHHQRINWEKGFGFAPLVGVTFGADTGYFDPEDQASRKKLVIGGSVSKTWRRISLEGELVHVPGFFTGKGDEKIITSSSVSSLTGNLIANLPGFDRLRPYAVAGLGAIRVIIRDAADVFPVSSWQPVVDIGGGVLVPLSRPVSIRADVRYTRSRRDEGAGSSIGFGTTYLDFWRTSVGIAIAF